MTLQSSGAISLSNVSVELGRSASATTSLGEAAVRALAGIASGPISLSNLYGKSATSFWYVACGSLETIQSFGTDSAGNIYAFGYSLIAKFNADGVLQWQRTINRTIMAGKAMDDGTVHLAGYWIVSGSNYGSYVARLDTNGNLIWTRSLDATGNAEYGYDVDTTATDVYMVGQTLSQGAGAGDALIAKWNSAGTFQWQRSLGGSGADSAIRSVVDASGNIYFVGTTASAGGMGGQDILIAKYNSAGTLAWQRSLGTSSADSGISITFNAAGNPVILGYGTATGNAIVANYDTSGNLLWQVQLPANFYPRDITADTAGNVYLVGNNYADSTGFVAKIDGSGNLAWSLQISTLAGFWVEITGAKVAGGGLVFNAQEWISIKNGSMVMASSIFKLPLDGSKTGLWGEFTGAAGSVTLSAGTLTGLTRALTSATRTLTAGSVAATAAVGSTTFTKTSI